MQLFRGINLFIDILLRLEVDCLEGWLRCKLALVRTGLKNKVLPWSLPENRQSGILHP